MLRLCTLAVALLVCSSAAADSSSASDTTHGGSPAALRIVSLRNLDAELEAHPLALVYFYSPTCGACKSFRPVLEEGIDLYLNQSREMPAEAAAAEDDDASNAAIRADRAEHIQFLAVDLSGGGAMQERAGKHYSVVKYPSLRLVVNGLNVAPTKFEEKAQSAEAIAALALTLGRRFHYETSHLAQKSELEDIIDTYLAGNPQKAVAEGRTIIIGRFDASDVPGSEDGVTACRSAFATAMLSLLDLPFLDVRMTFNDDVTQLISWRAKTDIALSGWLSHPDEEAPCAEHSALGVLKCAGIDGSGACALTGAVIPMPTTADQVIRAVATHALPPLLEYDTTTKILVQKAYLDLSVPMVHPQLGLDGLHPSKRGDRDEVFAVMHDTMRSGRRTRPVLIFFTQIRNCGPNTTEEKNLKYIKRTLREVAHENPTMSFIVADSYEYNTLFLRLGFKRQHARGEIVFGIFDGGRRFSSLVMNHTDGYSAQKVRDFVQAFNNGTATRYWKSSKSKGLRRLLSDNDGNGAAAASGQDASLPAGLRFASSRELERAMFRQDAPPTENDRRQLGGTEDVVFTLFLHEHCPNCVHLLRRFHRLGQLQHELASLIDDAHGAGAGDDPDSVPSMFLDTPPDVGMEGEEEDPDLAEMAAAAGRGKKNEQQSGKQRTRDFERESVEDVDGEGKEYHPHGNDDNDGGAASSKAGGKGNVPDIEALDEDAAFEALRERVLSSARATGQLSDEARALRRVTFFAVNASGNDPPTEHWTPNPNTNFYPVLGTVQRASRIAYHGSAASRGSWDVSVRSPVLFDLHTHRYGPTGPREWRLLEFVMRQLRDAKYLGQRFISSRPE